MGIFGSVTRQEQRQDSDLHVCVEGNLHGFFALSPYPLGVVVFANRGGSKDKEHFDRMPSQEGDDGKGGER